MLITKADDERLYVCDAAVRILGEDGIRLLIYSLRASLEREEGLLKLIREAQTREAALLADRDALRKRAEEAEGRMCRAREVLQLVRDSDAIPWDAPDKMREHVMQEVDAALSSSSPCSHAADLAAIRERNEKLEKVAEAARVVFSKGPGGYDIEDWKSLNAALRSLEEE